MFLCSCTHGDNYLQIINFYGFLKRGKEKINHTKPSSDCGNFLDCSRSFFVPTPINLVLISVSSLQVPTKWPLERSSGSWTCPAWKGSSLFRTDTDSKGPGVNEKDLGTPEVAICLAPPRYNTGHPHQSRPGPRPVPLPTHRSTLRVPDRPKSHTFHVIPRFLARCSSIMNRLLCNNYSMIFFFYLLYNKLSQKWKISAFVDDLSRWFRRRIVLWNIRWMIVTFC